MFLILEMLEQSVGWQNVVCQDYHATQGGATSLSRLSHWRDKLVALALVARRGVGGQAKTFLVSLAH